MIVIFQSKAAGDVIMFGEVAHRLLDIMGKDAEAKGIITVEQLPDAIARLRAAVEADKAARAGVADEGQSDSAPAEAGKQPFVSLTQRATPLLDLLRAAQKKGTPVVWGV